jgi:hypothetical protein
MAGALSVAELSARISAIENNSDPAAARSDALALQAQLEAQLAVDTAAWRKARDAFSDRHFGYSRYWGSSLREKARDVTPLEDKVVADQTTLQRLAKVVARTTGS